MKSPSSWYNVVPGSYQREDATVVEGRDALDLGRYEYVSQIETFPRRVKTYELLYIWRRARLIGPDMTGLSVKREGMLGM